ncbi:MAG: sulfite exporter TauE/SafE family protein [Anaerolineae bacterium]|nr:sulfite exporter TauE/SafE family protein [Anaerolineae bacterium]NUQ02402.1 sulfite exporter TauE/SafE family protein [Anaerolineae bacterium]
MDFVVIVALAGLIIGLSKGGLGAPLGAIIAPMLTIAFPVSEAVSLVLPLLIVGDLFALVAYWKRWERRYIILLLPPALIGIAVGTLLLVNLDNRVLKIVLGLFTLAFVIYKLLGSRLLAANYHPRQWHGLLAGLASGLASALANSGGIPFTTYMLLQDIPPRSFVGTTTLYFLLLNVLKLPGYIYAGLLSWERLTTLAAALPLIPVGVFIGRYVVMRIDRQWFERILLVVLTIAAFLLLFR